MRPPSGTRSPPTATRGQALVEELGIEPGPALQQLERDILRHEAGLEPRPKRRPAVPSAARADALPRQTTSFIGRARELEALGELLRRSDPRLLTLTGPGGAGKTRLALEAARRFGGGVGDGVCFVDLSPVREAAVVPAAIAEALGLGDLARHGGDDALGSYLSDRSLLLVLDNFEQVLDAGPAGCRPSRCRPPPSDSSSRAGRRCGSAQEHVYAVPPLELPASGSDLEAGPRRRKPSCSSSNARAGAGRTSR